MKNLFSGIFTEKIVRSLVSDEDKDQTTIETLDRLPEIYPEGKLVILSNDEGKSLLIRLGGKWMSVGLTEV